MTTTTPDTHATTTRWSAPTRSCAACRVRAPRELLLRYVAVESGEGKRAVRVDLAKTARGRGVNVGPSPLCLERAFKRGALQRRLGVNLGREDQAIVVAETAALLRARLEGYLRSAWRRGGLVAVGSLDEVVPRRARALWEQDELVGIVAGVPWAAARSAVIAARIEAQLCAVSEFTFTRGSGMKRRPEALEACEALERCGGGAIRGHVMTRRGRVGAGPTASGPDGENG